MNLHKLLQLILSLLIAFVSHHAWAGPLAIESRIATGPWTVRRAIEPMAGRRVLLRVKEVPGAAVRWFEIRPDIDIRYNNAVWPWLPNAYQWKGFDPIKYRRVHLKQFDGQWRIEPLAHPKSSSPLPPVIQNDGLFSYLNRRIFDPDASESRFFNQTFGTFRYQVEIVKGARTSRSPGMESKDNRGLFPKVFRISVRKDNSLIGRLTAFYNVPAVFGSTPYQVRNHIGIDCADVLMAAHSKVKNRPIQKDYNVAMLTRKFPKIKTFKIRDGRPSLKISWGKDIRAGDFIAVKYAGSKQYQHIGALYEDHNANGILDPEDLIIHAGPDPLHLSQLQSGMFDGMVVILRP